MNFEEMTVVLNVTDFITHYFDKLYIYEGKDEKGHQLGKFYGQNSFKPTVIRSNERTLYLRFVSVCCSSYKGFKILVGSYGK